MRFRFSILGILSAAYMACSGDTPNSPDTSHEAVDTTPPGFTISNAVLASPSRSQSAAARETSGSAYLSAAPNTFAGEADRVSIRNETSGAPAITASLINGGFDPVSIEGQEGDDVSVSLLNRGGLLSVSYVKIPPRRPPRIVRTTPDKGRIDVALDITIEVVFTEPIDRLTITPSMQLLRNGQPVAGAVRVSENGLIAEFDPEAALESGTSYTLSVTQDVRDRDGDQLAEPVQIEFRTGAALSESGTLVVSSSTLLLSSADIDPDGYFVQLDARPLVHIASQGSYTFNDVPVGAHVVSLSGVSDNCVSQNPSRGVMVRVREVDSVTLEVTCFPPPQLEGMLAFVSDRDGNAEIYTSHADGTDLKRLTNNPNRDKDPAWSPDGKRIAFARSENSTWVHAGDIYIMDADGSNVVQLTHNGASSYPTWSPDGRRIAYRDWGSEHRIVVLDLEEPSRTPQIVSFGGLNTDPAWSPDGTTIMFASDWLSWEVPTMLFTAKADGSSSVPARFPLPDPRDNGFFYSYLLPSWSPDGTRVAFAECDDYSYICSGSGRIGIAKADASGYRRLVEAINIERTTWSPDGTTIAYSSGTYCQPQCNPLSISYVTLDGRKGLILSDAYSPSWRPSPR